MAVPSVGGECVIQVYHTTRQIKNRPPGRREVRKGEAQARVVRATRASRSRLPRILLSAVFLLGLGALLVLPDPLSTDRRYRLEPELVGAVQQAVAEQRRAALIEEVLSIFEIFKSVLDTRLNLDLHDLGSDFRDMSEQRKHLRAQP